MMPSTWRPATSPSRSAEDLASGAVNGDDETFLIGDEEAAVEVVEDLALELLHAADALVPVAADEGGEEEGDALDEEVVPVGVGIGGSGRPKRDWKNMKAVARVAKRKPWMMPMRTPASRMTITSREV
jgi:hypothetical protein